ncbi:hypothetical protein [Arcicella rosea]|uniref:Uncharacterized protein n=1 Tax=Arcicella rosea TaxID=502909 RepID=A0A841EJX1_9BACT|nr:hypothetical protein [Arcicella rosea]MBB6003842.1 hypothetical protein [Arcicella rosea]
MEETTGTVVYGPVTRANPQDKYATGFANFQKGGHHSKLTIQERDAIFSEVREEGMTCFVKEDKITYILDGGLTNNFWRPESVKADFEYLIPPQNGNVIF